MTGTGPVAAPMIDARNAALVQAEATRSQAAHDAQIEYSETVSKLRESYEGDVAHALATLRAALLPSYQAYNAAVIAAEESVAPRVRQTV
jgi:hypothetical protein